MSLILHADDMYIQSTLQRHGGHRPKTLSLPVNPLTSRSRSSYQSSIKCQSWAQSGLSINSWNFKIKCSKNKFRFWITKREFKRASVLLNLLLFRKPSPARQGPSPPPSPLLGWASRQALPAFEWVLVPSVRRFPPVHSKTEKSY